MVEAQGANDPRLAWRPAVRRRRLAAAVLAVALTASMLATLSGRPAPKPQRAPPGSIRMKIVAPQPPSVAQPEKPRARIDLPKSTSAGKAAPARRRVPDDLKPGPVSAGVSLASSLGRPARPGCLDADPAGSLLSIPSLALVQCFTLCST